ncbi:MAG: ABC transporter ATP-binding protein [Flavobacteriales bacterium]|nr:ABC transporter ATP-binding protein [Flavobacteriales bacterium]
MKALKTLNKYFWKYKWRLMLGFVFIVCTNIFAVFSPQLVEDAVGVLRDANVTYFEPVLEAEQQGIEVDKDALVAGSELKSSMVLSYISRYTGIGEESYSLDSWEGLLSALGGIAVLLSLVYIVTYIIKGIFLFMTRQTIIVMSRLIEYDMKNDIYAHYQKLSMAFYKRNNTGDLMNRISEDVSKVRMYLGPAVMYTLNLVVLMSLVVGVMLTKDTELTLYALAPLPFMSIGVYYVSTLINKRSEAAQRQQSKLSTMVQETISGIRVLKAYNREKNSHETFTSESNAYKMRALDLVKIDALFMPIIVLLVGLSTILTIYIGGQKVIAGELEVGVIFSFVFYVNLLTWPFASVGWVTSLVQKAEASQTRINEFLGTKPEVESTSPRKDKIKGSIRFDNVSFTYPDSGIKALKDVSFDLEEGKTLAIIGRTGSGKSTIANLIMRQYDPTGGTILIDESPLISHNMFQIRENIGYVPQEVFLFSESIGLNIGFGVDNPTQEQIENAAKDAQVHGNIMDFPEKYDTLLGERGINLSGGQKQRISIARALIKSPRILMFDDCLSAVDTETEEAILSNLKRLMVGKTSIIISHRVSSIKHADSILVLDDGRVIESGTHQELVDAAGTYADLYQKQLLEEESSN